MSMYIGGSYDVLWALETVYLNKPPSSVLTSRQQMCLLCVCMDQHNTIILLIKALPPLIYTWPQEAMGGCHEEDPLHQELLKPSGDSISRSHDRNVTLSGVLLLNSSREERCKPSSHSLETKGVVPGGWRFLVCLDLRFQSRFGRQKDLHSKQRQAGPGATWSAASGFQSTAPVWDQKKILEWF